MALLNSTVSFTGDIGTESFLPCYREPLANLFGMWVRSCTDAADAGNEPAVDTVDFELDCAPHPSAEASEELVRFEFEVGSSSLRDEPDKPRPPDDEDGEGEELIIDFIPSIFVVGLLHVISNATQDLAKTLVYWPEFLPRLKQICRLLGRPWLKNRLKEQCFFPGRFADLVGSGAF